MIRTLLVIIFFFNVLIAFGCECAGGIGNNFLNQVDEFDGVVLGTFYKEDIGNGKAYLIIERVHKGSFKNDTLKLVVGTLCDSWLDHKSGERLIVGVKNSRYSDAPNAFTLPGCVTSSLMVNDRNKVKAVKNAKARRKPRIGWLSNTMPLNRLEKRIKNKI